jgi:hypothetical protein
MAVPCGVLPGCVHQVPCDFNGDADTWYDPEISETEIGWTCPTCETEHREAI